MQMLREPHSTDPHHLAARSDATVTQRTQLTSSPSHEVDDEFAHYVDAQWLLVDRGAT
jgi:hypothetical protein